MTGDGFDVGLGEAAIIALERRLLAAERELAIAREVIKQLVNKEEVKRWHM